MVLLPKALEMNKLIHLWFLNGLTLIYRTLWKECKSELQDFPLCLLFLLKVPTTPVWIVHFLFWIQSPSFVEVMELRLAYQRLEIYISESVMMAGFLLSSLSLLTLVHQLFRVNWNWELECLKSGFTCNTNLQSSESILIYWTFKINF